MINRRDHPVSRTQFMAELDDAHEHLGKLIQDMTQDPAYGDSELRVDLGHVLAQLHRAWYCRDKPVNLTDHEWEVAREAPSDLEPIA